MAVKDHSIKIEDDDANWLLWGKLIVHWIYHPEDRPTTARKLQKALDDHVPPIKGKVRGATGNTPVEFRTYDNTGPIIIPLPTEDMVENDWEHLKERVAAGNMKYPTPKFYHLIYKNPAKADFATYQDLEDEAVRRLGEYVINECM